MEQYFEHLQGLYCSAVTLFPNNIENHQLHLHFSQSGNNRLNAAVHSSIPLLTFADQQERLPCFFDRQPNKNPQGHLYKHHHQK
ncbi:MAG: hypothetical protein C5B52_17455 [Bacteroidetes bacterium]|nr:MAG: hypothetical protein C5B52_17455 [Bacteroidota bacterium]